MQRLRTLAAAGAASLLALTLADRADAFCGFYVSGADNKLFADATQVVLMREGTKTVLSMQNDYKGPPEKFAMVIPVPIVLQKENVKVLPREVFDKVDQLGAPRLVEYWEQDPCPAAGNMWGDSIGDAFGAGGLGLSGVGEGGGGTGRDLGVKVEAKFAVGEYEIVVLSAKDSSGLETWLAQEKYAIPEGAAPYFKPYITAGMKFFVAKVDTSKVKFEGGRATLSPLRFHYDSDKFTLPVRLGLINSSGKQDLIVSILAKRQRYEVANYPNVTIPTNLDVAESARGKFGEFYATLFDAVVEKNPKAVVTEYSWDAGTCDPCPGPTLDGNDLATLGADVVPGGTDGLSGGGGGIGLAGIGTMPGPSRPQPTLRQLPTKVSGRLPPEVIQRIVRQNFGRFRLCYENGLRSNPKLAGTATVKFTIGADGSVTKADESGGTITDAAVRSCIARSFKSLSFPQPEGGTVDVEYGIDMAPPAPVGSAATAPPPPPPAPVMWGGGMSTPYVLTRLHLRYDKDSMGEDLVFRAATAIAGGRESPGPSGQLEKGASASSVNNFQGRYAIRHPWTGAIACKEPRRNVWGGPPKGASAPTPAAARKTAFAARSAPLASFVKAPISELGVTSALIAAYGDKSDTRATAGSSSAPTPPPALVDAGAAGVATDAGATSDAGTTSPPPAKKGCAQTGSADASGGVLAGALGALGVALLRRRRRGRGDRRP